MSAKLYLILCILLIGLDAWVGTYFWMYLESMIFNEIYLVLFFLLDFVFISSNLKKLGFTRFELFVVGVLIFHLALGILILPYHNDSYNELRALKDTLLPIMFLMKCIIFRKVFSVENLDIYKKLLIKSCFLIVLLQVLLLIFKPDGNAYIGINPPVNILLASFFSGGPFFFLVLSLFALLLAGKRSIFISLVITGLFATRRMSKFALIACLLGALGYTLTLLIDATNIPIVNKFILTSNAINQVVDNGLTSEQREAALYLATAGRSAEIFAISAFLEPMNWLSGVGAGYSFELIRPDSEPVVISNAHFTPIAITYKFGVVIAFYFLVYTSKNIIWGLKNKEIFISSMLILFLIQSAFSFNLFAEILYPLFVSWLMVIRKNRKISIQN